jgi:hypothetical protein
MDKFEDPLEGIPLNALLTYRTKLDLNLIQHMSLGELILNQNLWRDVPSPLQAKLKSIHAIQKTTFVTCWFAEQQESLAMWNLYSNADGVAIKIPFEILTRRLKIEHRDVSAFYGGMVSYQNFNAALNTTDHAVQKVALRKDNSFKHECEFRAVVRINDHHNEYAGIDSIPVNLKSLKMKVVCHPRMAAWKKENIKILLQEAGIRSAYEESLIRLR